MERAKYGMASLNMDRNVSDMVRAAKIAAPRRPVQVEALHVDDLRSLVSYFERAASWYDRQMAPLLSLGYMGLLRCGELRRIKANAVLFLDQRGNHFYSPKEAARHELKGMAVHIPWRKQHSAADVWIPISCKRTTLKVLAQAIFANTIKSHFLFPSRLGRNRGLDIPNTRNPLADTQFYAKFRLGLQHACGFDADTAKLWAGHSIRIGASNYLRSLGVDPEVHRLLGGWAALSSSQGYMQFSMGERLKLHAELHLDKTRAAAFNKQSAMTQALTGTLSL